MTVADLTATVWTWPSLGIVLLNIPGSDDWIRREVVR